LFSSAIGCSATQRKKPEQTEKYLSKLLQTVAIEQQKGETELPFSGAEKHRDFQGDIVSLFCHHKC